MGATKNFLLGILAFTTVGCFLAAARSGSELHRRSAAIARLHLWQVWLPPARVAEPITDVVPAALEEEVPEARLAQLSALKKQRRRPIAATPVPAPAAKLEIEPEDAIRMALRSKRASFEHCYEQELKKQASFDGFIVIALSLSSSGQVTGARVQEGNRRDALVGACIAAQLRTIRLPPLTSEADLLIPIRLQARTQT